jgi:hypothetical protein
MEKITVEIDYDGALDIFLVVLEQQYGYLSPTAGGVPMYSYDKEENKKEYQRYKEAFKLVADYNGINLRKGKQR